MFKRKITVLIPAYNEENRIGLTIKALKELVEVKQIIVIDDGSYDNTGKLAQEEGAEVISLPINKGKGNALNIGAQYAKEELVALIDADLGESAKELKKLIDMFDKENQDMVIAIFPPPVKKGGVGLVKSLASFGLKVITKNVFLAPLSGQRLMTRQVFKSLLPFANGFGVEVGMTIDACLMGYKIVEVPTNMGHMETGRDLRGFMHRGRQLKDIFYTLTLKGWERWA